MEPADACDLGDGQHITFFDLSRADQFQRFLLHVDFAAGDRDPLRIGLVTDIHHAGAALFVEMGKLV